MEHVTADRLVQYDYVLGIGDISGIKIVNGITDMSQHVVVHWEAVEGYAKGQAGSTVIRKDMVVSRYHL
jgi:hypothetical protein